MYTTSHKRSGELTLPIGVDPRLDGRVGYREILAQELKEIVVVFQSEILASAWIESR